MAERVGNDCVSELPAGGIIGGVGSPAVTEHLFYHNLRNLIQVHHYRSNGTEPETTPETKVQLICRMPIESPGVTSTLPIMSKKIWKDQRKYIF